MWRRKKNIRCIFFHIHVFGYAPVWQVICYFWCGSVHHSIRYKISVCVLTWRLDHFHINAKWLSIFTWNILLSIWFCSRFMLSIAEPCFDLAIKRIIYHFLKIPLIFLKRKTTNKLKSSTFDRLTSLHYLWVQMLFWQSLFMYKSRKTFYIHGIFFTKRVAFCFLLERRRI